MAAVTHQAQRSGAYNDTELLDLRDEVNQLRATLDRIESGHTQDDRFTISDIVIIVGLFAFLAAIAGIELAVLFTFRDYLHTLTAARN